jgi:hypothetical protein
LTIHPLYSTFSDAETQAFSTALSSLPFKLFNNLRAEYDTDAVLAAHRQEILAGAQDDK